MANEFNPQGYRVKTGELSYALIWIGALFVQDAALAK
jgi:dihydroflavonol-4-reductase